MRDPVVCPDGRYEKELLAWLRIRRTHPRNNPSRRRHFPRNHALHNAIEAFSAPR